MSRSVCSIAATEYVRIMNSPSLEICPCPAPQREAALRLVFEPLPEPSRESMISVLLAAAERGEIVLDGLFAALDSGKPCGATWAQPHPGKTAVLWPPNVACSKEVAKQLVAQAVTYLDATDVSMTQTLLAREDNSATDLLQQAGFFHLADLSYLVRECDRSSVTSGAADLEFEDFAASQRSRLAQLLERTYVGTLDCPGLNGIRHIDDVIDGYQATGVFQPQHWKFVRHEDRDVGVLLLTDHPGPQHWEIVYMALVPEARGRGWGQQICRQALRLAAVAGQLRVVLAVDQKNSPALLMYEQAGFQQWDTRVVFLRLPACARQRDT